MSSARPGESSSIPNQSRRWVGWGSSGSSTIWPSTNARIPIGTLMKKIHRHETSSTSQPPRIGPTIGATSIGTPSTPMIRPMRCGPALRVVIVITAGMIIPPPRPWRTRKTISDSALQARPERTEPTVNRTSEVRYRRLVPKRSAAQPVAGITAASDSV